LGEKQVTYKHNRPKNKFNKRATNMTGMWLIATNLIAT
jgi:hypothetical protein